MLSDFLQEILIVIVLYNRKTADTEAFQSLLRLHNVFPNVLVCLFDNSREASPVRATNIIYHHACENKGVSGAYNAALDVAVKKQKKWMLLFDQDTRFDEKFFEDLFQATCSHSCTYVFVPRLIDQRGMVSPFRWKMAKGQRLKAHKEKLQLSRFRFANSGALISAAHCHAVGGFDPDIPLDFSDIAFGEKLMQITDHFVVVNSSLQHTLSSTERLSLSESLDRFYFFCRGAVMMGKKFGRLWLYRLHTFLRALKLTMFYKDPVFLKTLWQHVR